MISISVAVFFVLFFVFDAFADEPKEVNPVNTGKNEDLGWHYYWQDEPPEEEEEKKEPTVKSQTAEAKKPPFTTEWFRENFQKIQQAAIDNPSKENMRALLYVERVMADKSEVFARRKQFVQSTDPLLQEGTRIPMMGAAKNALMLYKKEQREMAFKELNNHVGIAFFYDGACQWCQQMIPVINYLKIKSDLNIRVFAKNVASSVIPVLDENIPVYPDAGYSKQFNISVWPALVMLKPPLDVYIITQGNITFKELSTRLINVAFEQNVLSEDWFYRIYPEQEGLITPEQLQNAEFLSADEPLEMIKQVIHMLEDPKKTFTSIQEGE